MASLLVISGKNEGDYYPLGRGTMVAGRSESCPIQIVDDQVSRKHLQIRCDPAANQHLALDMNSANGVWLNSVRMTAETALRDNDELQIGSTRILYTTRDFPDKQSALTHFKQRGQRGVPTISQ